MDDSEIKEMADPPNGVEKESKQDRITRILRRSDLMDIIAAHVASGGSVINMAAILNMPYGILSNWVHECEERRKRYGSALDDREQWAKENVLGELRKLGNSDLRELFKKDGTIKDTKDWPASVAYAVKSIQVEELWEGRGDNREQVGVVKKIQFWDKTKSLELLGKNLKLFIDKIEHSGKVKLEDLVTGDVSATDKRG